MTFTDVTGKTAIKFIMDLGILPFIALYLIYNLSTTLEHKIDQTSTELQAQGSTMQAVKTAVERQTYQNELLIDLQRQLCINAGRTYEDRAACWTLNSRANPPR